MNDPKHIIVHTLAFTGDAGVDEVRRWHKERGFADVGYHYIIRRDGTLETGRREHRPGAHCRDMGMNSKSIGVGLEGHGDMEQWTADQWRTFRTLYRFMERKYHIPPHEVLGHRETGAPKTCPGKKIDMDQVRRSLEMAITTNLTV